jgi:hypothetical protein
MSRTGGRFSPADAGTRALVTQHADMLVALPAPPATFAADDVPGANDNMMTITTLQRGGAVERVRRETVPIEGGERRDREDTTQRWRWRLADWAAELAAETVAQRDAMCPCGHAGLRNCGDHYQCGVEWCDRRFGRGELEVSD